jgi:hypothetical protein
VKWPSSHWPRVESDDSQTSSTTSCQTVLFTRIVWKGVQEAGNDTQPVFFLLGQEWRHQNTVEDNVRNALAYSFLENILPLFSGNKSFAFVILSLHSPCVGDRVDFVCRIKPHQLQFFLQVTLGCSPSLVLIHPFTSQVSGRLFDLLLACSFPVFNLSYLCLSCAWRWLYGYGCVNASNHLRHVSIVV